MRVSRVLLLLPVLVGAMSMFPLAASAQPERPCEPFPACFFGGGDEDDDDDGEEGSSGGVGDFTFGEGTAVFPAGTSTFVFAAASGPNGENASGFADANNVLGRQFTGPVTCLRVSGNRAAFEVDSNSPPDGSDVVFFVADHGVGVNVDEYNFHFLGQADTICPDPQGSELSVVAGDIVVGDNQPFPSGGDDDDDDDDDDG